MTCAMEEKKTMRVRQIGFLLSDLVTKYYNLETIMGLEMFLPRKYSYVLVPASEPADICLIEVSFKDSTLLRENETNIYVGLENVSAVDQYGNSRGWYVFRNNFGWSHPMVRTHIHNDKSEAKYLQDKDGKPVAHWIPTVYFRISHYHHYVPKIIPTWDATPFENKRFCLFASRNMMNARKEQVLNMMSTMGKIDTFKSPVVLQQFPNIGSVSCYYGRELLHLYSQYKFVLNFENSSTDGYVTEKIFNVLAAGVVPVYHGAPDIAEYVNKDCFVHCDGDPNVVLRQLHKLDTDKRAYEQMTKCAPKVWSRPKYNVTQTYLDD